MRILHLISSNGLLGAERVVVELSKGLSLFDNCYPIVGVLRNSRNPHTEVVEEAKSDNLGTVIFRCRGKLDPKTIIQIKKFLREDKIDVLHCHGYKSNFYGLLGSRNLIPAVTTNHNWLTSHWKLKLYCLFDSLWIRRFERIVAVSEEIKRDMMKYRVPEEKIEVIDNGIDIKRFNRQIPIENLIRGFSIGENVTVVGTIGSLIPEKGHIFLLKAAKELLNVRKDFKFLFVGDGPLRKTLENEARNLGIERDVIFTGQRSDIPELLSMMDIFVLPSVKEGLPMVVLEAMASKKPIIATRVGAMEKIITDNESGILIKACDIKGLKDSILGLTTDRTKGVQLSQMAFDRVKNEFSSKVMAERYMALYEELITRPKGNIQ